MVLLPTLPTDTMVGLKSTEVEYYIILILYIVYGGVRL